MKRGEVVEALGMEWEAHPVLRPPGPGWLRAKVDSGGLDFAAGELVQLHERYHEALVGEREDPIRCGFQLDSWHKAKSYLDEGKDEAILLGGNRSSKSEFGAWMTMNALLKNPGSKIWCWSQNDKKSKWEQQPYFWKYLPKELRKKSKGSVAKINYSKANGFTDNNFVLPNGSHCIFMTYTAFSNDPSIVEGAELGALEHDCEWTNVGNWFDEYLLGPDLLETLRMRLVTRNSKNLVTFTPVENYTETVRGFLHEAKTIESARSDPGLLEHDCDVPVIQQPKRDNSIVLYLHTRDNPFNDYGRACREWKGKPDPWIKCRAYGIPDRDTTTLFPGFDPTVHVMRPSDLPSVHDLTIYCVNDPAASRAWSLLWVGVGPGPTYYILREWPTEEWAVWKNGKWTYGDGAKDSGRGIAEYVDLVNDTEHELGRGSYDRYIDPRYADRVYVGPHGARSMATDLDEAGMRFTPAPGLPEEDGLQCLHTLLHFDRSRPVDSMNAPRLFISEDCRNVIGAIQNYPGKLIGGAFHPWKDWVDVLRYMATAPLVHLEEDETSTPLPSAQEWAGY